MQNSCPYGPYGPYFRVKGDYFQLSHKHRNTQVRPHSRDFFLFSIKMIKSIASLKADMFKDYMRIL